MFSADLITRLVDLQQTYLYVSSIIPFTWQLLSFI